MAKNLKAVPDDGAKPARATTTSFRIPVYWYDMARQEARRLDISISQVYLRALTTYFGTFDNGASWETSDESEHYDPSRFYTHSEDRKGHSFHVRANIPKPLAGEINSLIQSGIVPAYRSVGDVARDAIYHRLKWVSNAIDNAELEQAVDMAMMLSEELQLMDEAEHADQLIQALRTNAQSMLMKGSPARLKKYLAQRREKLDQIPEPYRDEYASVLDDYDKRVAKAEKPKRKRR